MNRRNKNDDARKNRNKGGSEGKRKTQSSKHNEDFNTGSHSPSSLLNVGPGYDDTGMGNISKTRDRDNKNTGSRQNTQKASSEKTRKV